MTMFAKYREIALQIKTALPSIAWVDRDKGQLDDPKNFNSLLIPAVLVDVGDVEWIGESRGAQTGNGTLTTKLVFRLPASTYIPADEDPIGVLDLYENYEQLTSHLHDIVNSISGVGDRRRSRDYFTGEYYVCEQTYDLTLYHTVPIRTTVKPPPMLSATIVIPQ